jgi:ketosteroid isomerase-like protein
MESSGGQRDTARAMSKENVEVIERVYSEFEQGNFSLPEFVDPSVRIVWLDIVGAETETVGVQAMSDVMRTWLEAYERLTLTAERLIDAGDHVVAIAVWRGSGKASGVTTELRHGSVWTLRDGTVTSVVSYMEPRDALKAAGLSE